MKKTNLVAIICLLASTTSVVYADITLESTQEVEGKWKLQYSKNSLTDKESIPREDTWIFKDSKLTILHIPREGIYYDQPPVPYEIEEGKLKVTQVGSSRFDAYTLVDKTPTNMTLKGKFGNYYYFEKK